MTISLDARTPSADIHTLTGSTLPGATRLVQPFSLNPEAVSAAGPLHLNSLAPDAEVIDLAGRVKALAVRDHRIWDRRAAIDDAVSRKFRRVPMPPQPARSVNSTVSEVEAGGMCVTTIAVPTAPDPVYEAASLVYAAAVADRLRLEAEMEARLGYPRWEKLSRRTFVRLVRWTKQLALLQPVTQQGMWAKAEVQGVLTGTGNAGDWTAEFSAAVGRDVARLATALAKAEANHPDAELLALASAWEASAARCGATATAYDEATERLYALDIRKPEALYRTDRDHKLLGPYGSELPSGRRWYGDPSSIEALRQGYPGAVGEARRFEIVEAYDRWQAEKQAAEEETGYAAARAADMEAGLENSALRSTILALPARTLDGVLLKARVARWCFMDDEDEIAMHLATEAKDAPATGETMAFSILLDLARIVGAEPAAVPAAGTASNIRPAPMPADLSSLRLGADGAGDVREWYRSWLYAELRLLTLELDGSPDRLAIRQDNPGAAFHYPSEASWTDVPKPSTRAAAVLGLFGILPIHDGAGDLARVA